MLHECERKWLTTGQNHFIWVLEANADSNYKFDVTALTPINFEEITLLTNHLWTETEFEQLPF